MSELPNAITTDTYKGSGIFTVTLQQDFELDTYAVRALRAVVDPLAMSPECSALVIDTSGMRFIDGGGVNGLCDIQKACAERESPIPLVIDNFGNRVSKLSYLLRFTKCAHLFYVIEAGQPTEKTALHIVQDDTVDQINDI